ncbi:hypothetical protein M9Y10_023433 [Tritrichomonas musculus]|uniref:Uncharacterized protein n=1 Tax=Tritrichomonas musculus TaxID=1915356 RepID=A0ABR2KW50_9EUKA
MKMRAMQQQLWILRGDPNLQQWVDNLTGIYTYSAAIVRVIVQHATDWGCPCPVLDDVQKQCDSFKRKLILLKEYQQENIRPMGKEAQKIIKQNSGFQFWE